jgi:hypothetical protein
VFFLRSISSFGNQFLHFFAAAHPPHTNVVKQTNHINPMFTYKKFFHNLSLLKFVIKYLNLMFKPPSANAEPLPSIDRSAPFGGLSATQSAQLRTDCPTLDHEFTKGGDEPP